MASAEPYEPDALDVNPFADELPARSSHLYESNAPTDGGFEDVLNDPTDDQSTPLADEAPPSQEDQTSSGGTEGSPSVPKPSATTAATATDKASPATPVKKRAIKRYKLNCKITGIERVGKKDPIIKFDTYTTLPRFRTTTFKDIRRTHGEFVKFFTHLNGNNPECFVPSLPPATTSAGAGTEEDDTKTKKKLQQWLDRVSSDPLLARDEEFVHFIEADFGYAPVVKKRPPATGLTRKAMKQLQPPPDDTPELADFRPMIKQVHLDCEDIHSKVEKQAKSRRSLGLALTEFGQKCANNVNTETVPGMTNMWNKLSKTIIALGDIEAVKATVECSTIGDAFEGVSKDAYVVKEALTNRQLLMRELGKAQNHSRSKHQAMDRVKASTSINPLKVDEAIAALEEAKRAEDVLTNRMKRISDNMLLEKKLVLSRIDQDLTSAISEYVLRRIESERRVLGVWEAIRLDVRQADAAGGLSRLGRESFPTRRSIVFSQSASGDAWSGDRKVRAAEQTKSDEEAGDDDEVVDARNAASLLGGSTF